MGDESKTNVYERNSAIQDKKKAYVRIILTVVVLTVFATLIYFLRFKLPIVPSMFAVEFSSFFELIAGLAYGPLVGVLVCFIKNFVFVIIYPHNFIPNVSNLLVDSTFVVITSLYYIKSVSPDGSATKAEVGTVKYRRNKLFIGSVIGMLPTMIVQFYATNDFAFPLLMKYYYEYGYDAKSILLNYQATENIIRNHLPEALAKLVPNIDEIWKGVILFNLPITFGKFLIVSVVALLVYPHVSPYLHFIKESK